MYKTDLIDYVATSTGCPKTQSSQVMDSLIVAITNELSKGNVIHITGFGRLAVDHRAAHTVLGKTGGSIKIPAMNIPRFIPDEALKAAINKK